MIDCVKCFGEINSTQIGCSTASRDVAIHNISHCTNSIAASDSFLEAKLIVWSCKERAESVQYTVLKNFWKDGAYGNGSLQVNDLLWYSLGLGMRTISLYLKPAGIYEDSMINWKSFVKRRELTDGIGSNINAQQIDHRYQELYHVWDCLWQCSQVQF